MKVKNDLMIWEANNLLEELYELDEYQDDNCLFGSVEHALETHSKIEEAVEWCDLADLDGHSGMWAKRAKKCLVGIFMAKYQ